MTDRRAQVSWTTPHVHPTALLLVLARFLLAAEFMTYGVRKALHPENIHGVIAAHHLPGELVYLVIPWQIGFGWAVFLGFQARLAALALFGFCVIAPSIFWLDNASNLTRDYATAGGFVFLFAFGAGAISLDAVAGRSGGGGDILGRFLERFLGSRWESRLPVDKLMAFGRALIALPFLAAAIRSGMYPAYDADAGRAASYLPTIIAGVGGLMLLAGYRARIAATVLMVWSLAWGFGPHSPLSFLGIGTEHLSTVIYNLFQKNGGPLSSFFKDISVAGALLMLVVYGSGALSWDARASTRRADDSGHLRSAGVQGDA